MEKVVRLERTHTHTHTHFIWTGPSPIWITINSYENVHKKWNQYKWIYACVSASASAHFYMQWQIDRFELHLFCSLIWRSSVSNNEIMLQNSAKNSQQWRFLDSLTVTKSMFVWYWHGMALIWLSYTSIFASWKMCAYAPPPVLVRRLFLVFIDEYKQLKRVVMSWDFFSTIFVFICCGHFFSLSKQKRQIKSKDRYEQHNVKTERNSIYD